MWDEGWNAQLFTVAITSIRPFVSVQIAPVQADHPQTTPLADFHEAQLSSTHLMTLAQLVAPITVEEMWRMQQKRETIEVPLMENCI